MSKWFKQYCELNILDRNMICDRLENAIDDKYPYWEELYVKVVYFEKLTDVNIEDITDRLNSARDKRPVRRLIEKLERLRSQS